MPAYTFGDGSIATYILQAGSTGYGAATLELDNFELETLRIGRLFDGPNGEPAAMLVRGLATFSNGASLTTVDRGDINDQITASASLRGLAETTPTAASRRARSMF